jgi:hypothetical protein
VIDFSADPEVHREQGQSLRRRAGKRLDPELSGFMRRACRNEKGTIRMRGAFLIFDALKQVNP